MNEQLDRLYRLHVVDEHIHRAQQGLKALEEPPPLEAQLQKVKAELARQETLLHKAQADLKDLELQLKSVEGKREQDRQKLYGGKIVGTKELQALEREIESLEHSIGDAEGRVLEAMDKVEPIQANVNKLKEYQSAAEAKLAALGEEREKARRKLQADLITAQPMREPSAREVDPALLTDYEKIRARRGHPGLAVIEGGSCGFCHTSIPSMVMRELRDGDVLHCDTCSRIYYLPPSPPAG
jgi:predicted  nucleic acid-binding Zn-ribbon protein